MEGLDLVKSLMRRGNYMVTIANVFVSSVCHGSITLSDESLSQLLWWITELPGWNGNNF